MMDKPSFPFDLKESSSRNGKGMSVIRNNAEFQKKLVQFTEYQEGVSCKAKITSLVHCVKKRGLFTGVFSLEFKMDFNMQLLFLSCTSALIVLFDSGFMASAAYCPLTRRSKSA